MATSPKSNAVSSANRPAGKLVMTTTKPMANLNQSSLNGASVTTVSGEGTTVLSAAAIAAMDKILACPSLPSLPGVAIKVLELTRDPNVSIGKIADLVQNDPALASKVLKTINSSFYALAHPCPSIPRAMSLLGLNTVKAIVLGFSLVDSAKKVGEGGGFDLSVYWRRCVYGAAGARMLAIATKRCDPEEAFLGGLLQDIGVLATFSAMKDSYGKLVAAVGVDHDELAQLERQTLGFDHTHVGAKLAERWRFPAQVVECIAKHHSPQSAQIEYESLVRCVHLGGLAAGALTLQDSRKKMGGFIVRGREWFEFTPDVSKAHVQTIAKNSVELSKMLDLRTGAAPDTTTILAQAHEQMLQANEGIQNEAIELRRSNSELSIKTVTDPLTGAFNRAHFDEQSEAMFTSCVAGKKPFSALFIDADKFKSVNDTHGHKAGDAVLIELSKRLRESVGKAGVVCRYGGEEFAILLPGIGLEKAARVAEILRAGLERKAISLANTGAKANEITVTVSVGVASTDAEGFNFANASALVHAADQGLYVAKRAGRNRVMTCVEAAKSEFAQAATGNLTAVASAVLTGPSRTILLVEDDALASKLLEMVLGKREDVRASFAKSGEEAMEMMIAVKFDVLISDVRLPGMDGVDLVRKLRTDAKSCPGILVLTSADPSLRIKAIGAGADLFVDKMELCSTLDACLDKIFAVKPIAVAA